MAMKALRRLIPLMMVLALAASSAALGGCGQSSQSIYQPAIKLARGEIWNEINSGKTCAATVAVMDGGKIVYSEGFGMADRENSVPVNPNTIFNIGSASKTFDAAAVMRLVDDGKVSLDTPVVRYVPEFKMPDPRYKDITVRMLLDHSCALPGTTAANDVGHKINPSFYEDFLNAMAHSDLKASPGEYAPYCNDAWTLAEILVARVSGQKYIDFLNQRILGPLNLNRTGVSVGERGDKNYAAFYQPDTGEKMPPETMSVMGAGGLSSTAEDLVRFMDSFSGSNPQALSSGSVKEMTTLHSSRFAKRALAELKMNPESPYGFGFDFIQADPYKSEGIKVIGKDGATDVYHSIMVSAPDRRISVAVIEAGQSSNPDKIGLDILNSVLVSKGLVKKQEQPAAASPEPQPIPAQYASYSGYYGGSSYYRLSIDPGSGAAAFAKIMNGQQDAPIQLSFRDGAFYTSQGSKFMLISVAGGQYFVVASPLGIGNAVVAERLADITSPQSLRVDLEGKQWLRRNQKPWEGIPESQSTAIVVSALGPLPGYVDFNGPKRVESPDRAGMATRAVRDLSDLTLLDKEGGTWVQNGDLLYSPLDTAAPLETGTKSVTIGRDGYSEWLSVRTGLVLGFSKPPGDRVIVFGPDGIATYDSVIDSGPVFVPAGSLVELAGNTGDVLKVTAK